MPQIGPLEILVVAAIALIVFGPERLPHMARQIGKFASEMRRMAIEVRDEFQMGLDDDEEDEEDTEEPARDPEDVPVESPSPDGRGTTESERAP